MVMLNAQQAKSEDDFSGNARLVPGRYHVAVNHAEEKGSKKKGTPGLECEFQVICDGLSPDGKTPTSGQGGRTMPLFLSYVSEKGETASQSCIDRVTRLALCCSVLKAGEAKEPDWQDAIGRELVIEVENGTEYEDDKGNKKPGNPQISFMGFWSLGNKEVANVPKDTTTPGMQQLAKAGGSAKPPVAGGDGIREKAPAIPAAPTTAAGKPRGKFSDL